MSITSPWTNGGRFDGLVSLVGAGPGNPKLITLLGLERLRQCDVVVHDRLIPWKLLREVKPTCDLIDVGKKPGFYPIPQNEINRILADRAGNGLHVVRLKGGDPSIFGRMGEECLFLSEAGIPFEIIPGVTAASAAASALGIPLTHRGIASCVALVTGQEAAGKSSSKINWEALGKTGTLAFYMSREHIPSIIAHLKRAGLPAKTPVAVCWNASTPNQKTLITTLGKLESESHHFIKDLPALYLVGEVASLPIHPPWKPPLSGIHLGLTHNPVEDDLLTSELISLGAEVISFPSIQITPPDDLSPLFHALNTIHHYDWILLTSRHGVAAFMSALDQIGRDSRHLHGCKIAVVGEATAQSLKQFGLRPDLIPRDFSAEHLAQTLLDRNEIQAKTFLYPASDIARETLVQKIESGGGTIHRVTAYCTRPVEAPWTDEKLLKEGQVDALVFQSSSAVRYFFTRLQAQGIIPQFKICFSIGRKTTETLQSFGITTIIEAERSDQQGLLDCIRKYYVSTPKPVETKL